MSARKCARKCKEMEIENFDDRDTLNSLLFKTFGFLSVIKLLDFSFLDHLLILCSPLEKR